MMGFIPCIASDPDLTSGFTAGKIFSLTCKGNPCQYYVVSQNT